MRLSPEHAPKNRADDKLSSTDRWSIMQRAGIRMRSHRAGLTYLEGLLLKAKAEISEAGHISQETQYRIHLSFGMHDFWLARACSNVGPPVEKVQQHADNTPAEEDGPSMLAIAQTFIDNRLDQIKMFKGYAIEREKLEQDANARALSLPPTDVTDKLVRYEAHIDRQLDRAMNQLERMQRARKGENIPPPVNITVGKS